MPGPGISSKKRNSHSNSRYPVPKSMIEVLNQEISDEKGTYRIRASKRVHYLTIPTNVFDDDTMCRPYLLIPQLPDFPDADWTRMSISRGENGVLEYSISYDPLPSIPTVWHPELIDVLSLPQLERHRSGVHETSYKGQPAVSKIARFEWNYRQMDNETWAYSILQQHRSAHEPPIAPAVLGHLTENGRVMGLLLEKVEGRFASAEDHPQCEKALRRLHGHPLQLVHGDVNRYNFIIEPRHGHVRLIDFEYTVDFDAEMARSELASLASELAEETGRGGPCRLVEEI